MKVGARRGLAVFLGLLALALGSFAVWLWAEAQLARGLQTWTEQTALSGGRFTHAPPEREGWPVAARLQLPRPQLSAGPFHLSSDDAILAVSPLRPGSLRVALPAPLSVSAGASNPVTITSPDWTADVALAAPWPVVTRAVSLRLSGLLEGGEAVHLDKASASLRPDPATDTLALDAAAGTITLPSPPPGLQWPMGPEVVSLDVAAMLTQASRLGPFDAAAAVAWRDASGRLAIRSLSVRYGPLEAALSATLTLDARLQPAGSGTLRLVHVDAALDAMTNAHAMTAAAARAVAAVLRMLATPVPGVPDAEQLPVAVAGGTVSAGGFPLLVLPPLRWTRAMPVLH